MFREKIGHTVEVYIDDTVIQVLTSMLAALTDSFQSLLTSVALFINC